MARTLLDVILGRGKNSGPQAGYFFNSVGGTSFAGQTVSVDNVLKNTTVLSCVQVISQGIAQLPWEIWKAQDIVANHTLTGVLNRPNSFQTNYEFKSAVVQDILIYGNSFTRVVRAKNGRVIELIPMAPNDLTVAANSFGIPVYNHKTYGDLTAQEVIHVRDISGHSVEGRSRILLAAERIACLNAADNLMAETFISGVSINYSVELEATLDDASREALYAQLKNAFGQGGSRRGGIAVLEGGKLSAIKGSTPADADLRELRGDLINEIAALFRVPASLVGGLAQEKYSNVTARLASMYRDSFAPIIISIEQAFTNNLLSNGNTLRFDVGSLVKGDLATQITLATQAVAGGIITPNEARVFIGYPEIEGLDEVQAAPQAVPPDADRSGEETTDDGNMADMPDT